MHSCVGRIRYLGVLLYDADQIEAVASADDLDIVARQMDMILDPFDPDVIAAANALIVYNRDRMKGDTRLRVNAARRRDPRCNRTRRRRPWTCRSTSPR